jgi:hypothetical protein
MKKTLTLIGCVIALSTLMAARTGILNGLLQSDMDGAQFKILNLARVETGTAAVSGKQTINVNSGVTQTTSVATALDVTTGSPATPITTANTPSVVISRREGNISGGGDGSDGPALYVVNHSAGTQQNVGIASKSVMLAGGSNDVVGVYAQGENYGTASTKAAFGLFAHAYTNTAVGAAIAIETQTTNDGSYDDFYSPTVGVNRFIGLDINYSSGTSKRGAVGAQIRGSQWDVGVGFMSGIAKAEIQSDSSATSILLANSGSHTNGIDLRLATFSGSPFVSTGFDVGPTGNITGFGSVTLTNASNSGLDLGSGTKVTRVASDGHLKLESQNGVIEGAGAINATSTVTGTNLKATAIGARAYNNANIAITTGVVTALTFNSERWDSDTIHDTGSNTSRLTCKTAGKYIITGNIEWAADATSVRTLQIRVNGSTAIGNDSRAPLSGVLTTSQTTTTIYDLAVNDYVELVAYQATAGNLNVLTTANYSPEFSMVWMGP